MKLPFSLRRTASSDSVTAMLIPTDQADVLFDFLTTLGSNVFPNVYRTADGFLLIFAEPTRTMHLGTHRFKKIGRDVYIPVDAELQPPLLPDEAENLGRLRGLVFLPTGQVLEFRPDQPLDLSSLVRVNRLVNDTWKSIPDPPELAGDLFEIEIFEADQNPDELLEQGGEGIGTDSPDVGEGKGLSNVAGNALFGFGKGLAWLGKNLSLSALSKLGGQILNQGMSLAPQLSESLIGKQQALLRKLLQEFRNGNVENALRHALPIGGEPGRGGGFASDARLPLHDLFYSLSNLFTGSGAGGGTIWLTPDSTFLELAREYNKQAELALKNGDYRRAAFIYAKLLNNFGAAARALSQGGLHRDAAILYEKKLLDRRGAAREWEAAGNIDRAIEIYRQLGENVLAGDLLQKVGEVDLALKEYRIAAGKLVDSQRHFQAGSLLIDKARRLDLALEIFAAGWEKRPKGQHFDCFQALFRHFCESGNLPAFHRLRLEAERDVDLWNLETASTFFNLTRELSRHPHLANDGDDLRDGIMVQIARRLRTEMQHTQGKNPVGKVAALMPAAKGWGTPAIQDAQFAAKHPTATSRTWDRLEPKRFTVSSHRVTAWWQDLQSGVLYFGNARGQLLCFDPRTENVTEITAIDGSILAITGTRYGQSLVSLSAPRRSNLRLSIASRERGYRQIEERVFDRLPSHALLLPLVANDEQRHVAVTDCHSLILQSLENRGNHSTQLMDSVMEGVPGKGTLITHGLKNWLYWEGRSRTWILPLPFDPTGAPFSFSNAEAWGSKFMLEGPPLLATSTAPDRFELQGLTEKGALRIVQLDFSDGTEDVAPDTWFGEGGVAFIYASPYRTYLLGENHLTQIHPVQGVVKTQTVRLENPVGGIATDGGRAVFVLQEAGDMVRFDLV